MQHDEMRDTDKIRTGTKDTSYDLVSVLYHALQGAENYDIYAQDAEQRGMQDEAKFFKDLKQQEINRADRAKGLLAKHLQQEGKSRM